MGISYLLFYGNSPYGPGDRCIELHHLTQKNESALAEVTASFHQKNKTTLHINPNSTPSGINRSQFKTFRSNYWKNRLNDFN